jgi:hypothetical protein
VIDGQGMARVQSFWHGRSIPHAQRLCMRSFLDHGHAYDLYSYGRPAVPPGVRVLNADEILPRSSVFCYRAGPGAGSVSGFANMFRYRLLMLRGGWWVDTDVLCLSPHVPEGDLYIEREDERTIGNAVMCAPAGHWLPTLLYERSLRAGDRVTHGQTGPALLTSLMREAGLWHRARPPGPAFPIHYDDAFLPVTAAGRDAAYEKTRDACFVHLWNEVFRRARSMALHNPPAGSFLADAYQRHHVGRRFWSVLDRYKLHRMKRQALALARGARAARAA